MSLNGKTKRLIERIIFVKNNIIGLKENLLKEKKIPTI